MLDLLALGNSERSVNYFLNETLRHRKVVNIRSWLSLLMKELPLRVKDTIEAL